VIWPLAPSCAEGVLARVAGLEHTDNPYDATNADERHRTWLWGWWYAERVLAANIEHLAVGWHNEEEAA
jgi:hypothetical protein